MDKPLEKNITHHPLRTIELAYHRDRPQPEWEKETLSKYIHLHDEVWRLKTMCEEYKARLDQLAMQINEGIKAIKALRPQLILLEAVTGIRAAIHAYREDESRLFRIDINEFFQKRDEIPKILAEIRPKMARCKEEYDRYNQAVDAFDDWFETFDSGPMLELYRRYDEARVDTVSLDHDHQNLLEVWQPIIFAEREYHDDADRVLMNYDHLEEVADFLFEDIDMVEEALRDLQYTGKSGIINIKRTDDGEYHAF